MGKIAFGKDEPAAAVDVVATPVVESTVTVGKGDGNPVKEVVDATPVDSIPTKPVSANTNTAVATREAAPGFNDEDIDFSDIMLPRLNLVYGVGDLSLIYNPGEWVLNGSLVVHVPKNDLRKVAGEPPLSLTVIGFKKRQYVEKTTGGAQGNLFNTQAEVVKANGTLDYKEAESTGKRLYHTLATALILVRKPEHIPDEDHLLFAHECEGKFYSLALWGMKSTMFTHAAKKIFTARKLGHLKSGGYPSFSWELTTKFETKYEQPTPIPALTIGAKNTETFAKFVNDVLTSGN